MLNPRRLNKVDGCGHREALPSVRVPLGALLLLLPRMIPRPYTIASAVSLSEYARALPIHVGTLLSTAG